MTATMIIRIGNTLEFADCNGKSLGKFGCLQAQAIFDDVSSRKTETERQQLTQIYYEQIIAPDEIDRSTTSI